MNYIYKFEFPNRPSEEFTIDIAACTPNIQSSAPDVLPEWTELSFKTCPHCPLNINEIPHCPLALHISGIIDFFEKTTSHHETSVTVTTDNRTYTCSTTIQQGLSSLLGLVIATSGCPHTEFLRPMAHFHLPVSTPEETIYRAVGMYFIGQFFHPPADDKDKLDLSNLNKLYANVETVNMHIAARLRTVTKRDAPINAIVLLDNLAKSMSIAIEEQLEEIRNLWDDCS
jgi:hypothetical protein